MENFFDNIFQIPLISGACFLLAAGLMKAFPPRKINPLYGYRTTASMHSQEQWDFAQSYSTVQMAKAALLMILFSFVGFLMPDSADINLIGGLAVTFAGAGYIFITTEKEIKKRFSS